VPQLPILVLGLIAGATILIGLPLGRVEAGARPRAFSKQSSRRFLGVLGLAGGPTAVGTVVGQAWVNPTVSVAFLGLAAGGSDVRKYEQRVFARLRRWVHHRRPN